MINYDSFAEEIEKIAAHKCRAGSMPIRAHNLAAKTSYDGSRSQAKLAFDVKKLKAVGLVGGGAIGALTVNQAAKDWSLGRQIRKQQGG